MLFVEKQKCEHVANNDVKWLVDSTTSHHVSPKKGLFTTYKAGDFGTIKMDNSNYLKIVGICDMCIETNVGSIVMLNNVQHVSELKMNVFSTLAIDRVGYCNHHGNER